MMYLVSLGGMSSAEVPGENENPHLCANEEGIILCRCQHPLPSVTLIWSPHTQDISFDLFPSIGRDHRIKLIASNIYFTVYATVNHEIWTYGMNRIRSSEENNSQPLLELVSKANEIIPRQLVCGYSHVLVVDEQNHAYSFGRADCGQLGLGSCVSWVDSPQRIEFTDCSCSLVESVSAGSSHSAFVLKNGRMYVCGSSDSHRLGLRTQSDMDPMTLAHRPIPCLVEDLEEIGFSFESFDATGVKLSSCGVWHTVAVMKETNDVYAWGWAKFGQFGRYDLFQLIPLIIHSWKETYYPNPTRLSILDHWVEDTEEISQVICGSRFTAILTSFNRLLIL